MSWTIAGSSSGMAATSSVCVRGAGSTHLRSRPVSGRSHSTAQWRRRRCCTHRAALGPGLDCLGFPHARLGQREALSPGSGTVSALLAHLLAVTHAGRVARLGVHTSFLSGVVGVGGDAAMLPLNGGEQSGQVRTDGGHLLANVVVVVMVESADARIMEQRRESPPSHHVDQSSRHDVRGDGVLPDLVVVQQTARVGKGVGSGVVVVLHEERAVRCATRPGRPRTHCLRHVCSQGRSPTRRPNRQRPSRSICRRLRHRRRSRPVRTVRNAEVAVPNVRVGREGEQPGRHRHRLRVARQFLVVGLGVVARQQPQHEIASRRIE